MAGTYTVPKMQLLKVAVTFPENLVLKCVIYVLLTYYLLMLYVLFKRT